MTERRALAGTGLVIRKIPPKLMERIVSTKPSKLGPGEKAIKHYLENKQLCQPVVYDSFVQKVLSKPPLYRKNDVYLGFTLYPKTRSTKKQKGSLKYKLAGVVTVGPFRFESNDMPFRFKDDTINAAGDAGLIRDIDLVCATGISPPMTATVMMVNAITADSAQRPNAIYSLQKLPRYKKSSINAAATRLGFRHVTIITTDCDGDPIEDKWQRMVLDDASDVSVILPNAMDYGNVTMDEICDGEGGCTPSY